ncbi:MAG: hypothetical protein EA415_08450, partial [Sphaerobacteraceae bacterium]
MNVKLNRERECVLPELLHATIQPVTIYTIQDIRFFRNKKISYEGWGTAMARGKGKRKQQTRVEDYRYDDQRLNNPPVGLASYEKQVSEPQVKTYPYDPHLSPQLVWAGKPGLESIEVADAAGIDVETMPLHIHERVSTRAIIDAV